MRLGFCWDSPMKKHFRIAIQITKQRLRRLGLLGRLNRDLSRRRLPRAVRPRMLFLS